MCLQALASIISSSAFDFLEAFWTLSARYYEQCASLGSLRIPDIPTNQFKSINRLIPNDPSSNKFWAMIYYDRPTSQSYAIDYLSILYSFFEIRSHTYTLIFIYYIFTSENSSGKIFDGVKKTSCHIVEIWMNNCRISALSEFVMRFVVWFPHKAVWTPRLSVGGPSSGPSSRDLRTFIMFVQLSLRLTKSLGKLNGTNEILSKPFWVFL